MKWDEEVHTTLNSNTDNANYSHNSTRQDYSPSSLQAESAFRRRRLNVNNNDEQNVEPFDHPDYYAYLIVHYHKTGHHLSHQLRDLLLQASNISSSSSSTTPFVHPIHLYSNEQEHSFKARYHEMETGCPTQMYLPPGVVSVQAAPNFFCNPEILAEYLLRNVKNPYSSSSSANPSDFATDNINNLADFANMQSQQQQQYTPLPPPHEKRGIKIIHLVRNPYTLSISNWIYHTQYPTPESWVKRIDPCTPEFWREHETLASMVSSTLLSGMHPIMEYSDFDALHSVCTSLFRSSATSLDWSYYTHLRHLDPPTDSLSLSTSHMMVQGISGGDILRMANNILKLKQVQQLEERVRLSRHDVGSLAQAAKEPRMIQVLTLSMDEFMIEPGANALRFLDFAFGGTTTVPREVKEELAMQYEQSYHAKLNDGDVHITANKVVTNGQEMDLVERKEEWMGYLRGHELFGRILGNIEMLVNDALADGG
ncbi:hypothetical protein ACHAWU_001974 [Discostella pseudostelligera]|uniref:Sulfotransferase n=1 Tax=Discostella pseudostelligera TaxID=259834 RepID=A0ABD3MN59_9STRA